MPYTDQWSIRFRFQDALVELGKCTDKWDKCWPKIVAHVPKDVLQTAARHMDQLQKRRIARDDHAGQRVAPGAVVRAAAQVSYKPHDWDRTSVEGSLGVGADIVIYTETSQGWYGVGSTGSGYYFRLLVGVRR